VISLALGLDLPQVAPSTRRLGTPSVQWDAYLLALRYIVRNSLSSSLTMAAFDNDPSPQMSRSHIKSIRHERVRA